MTSPTETPSLTSLYTISYQDENGAISPNFCREKLEYTQFLTALKTYSWLPILGMLISVSSST